MNMARRCEVTGKGVLVGNNVSHANNKTRCRFLPNLQVASFYSVAMDKSFRFRLSTNGIRTIEHKGGLDAYVAGTPEKDLPKILVPLKKKIKEVNAAV